MKILGITGPTGAGKTTVLRYLASCGATIIDCDALYHKMLAEKTPLRDEIACTFPDAFLPSGELDRKKLGKLVFDDEAQMAKLNALVYLHLGNEVRRQLFDLQSSASLAVIDAVNLISSGLGDLCHLRLCVLADEEKRVARIVERDGISYEYALLRARAQEGETYYLQNCQVALYNNGTEEELLQRAQELLKDFLKGD